MPHFAGLTEINPLKDYQASFDLFYQFVKGQVIGKLKADQYLQLQTIAEPFDASVKYPFFTLYNYLCKEDQLLKPVPLSDQFVITAQTFYNEYYRFVETALSMIEATALPPDVVDKINAKKVQLDNLKADISRLIDLDSAAWTKYANLHGIPAGDNNQYTIWSNRYGYGNDIEADAVKQQSLYGDLEQLRRKEYADANQREIKDAWDLLCSVGMRIRYPRADDRSYPDGSKFSLPYLASLPTGDGAVFADRPVIFPQLTIDTITGDTAGGGFDVAFNKDTKAVESSSIDWGGSASGSYSWFSASVNASESVSINQEWSHTENVGLSCKTCFIAAQQPPPWLNTSLFVNKLILANKNSFMRYLGPGGTLLYYPTGLILMRGFKITFSQTNGWKYDYVRDFQVGGSASARFFGIGMGGSYHRHEHQEDHQVQHNGDDLTFSDGDSTLRVLGYVAQKNTAFVDQLTKSVESLAFKP